MITEDFDQPANQPPRLTPIAIDLAVYDSDQGEQVVMRIIDITGARVDVLIERSRATAFGLSLAEYASADPVWL
jgi:hypothetical protein